MKKILILSSFMMIVTLSISCKREISEAKPASTTLTAENFKKYNLNADGNVFVTLDEYFDQPVTLTSTTLSASFKKGDYAANVGSVFVNNNQLNRNANNSYLLNQGIESRELLNSSIKVRVDSKNSNFPSIRTDVKVFDNLMVKSNIGLEGVLKKNQDLVLTWTPKNKSGDVTLRTDERLYLGIAAAGVQPISRELSDNGQVTIPASELSNLPNNAQAVVRLGRVSQSCSVMNGTTVCVNVLNSATSGPLVVQ